MSHDSLSMKHSRAYCSHFSRRSTFKQRYEWMFGRVRETRPVCTYIN